MHMAGDADCSCGHRHTQPEATESARGHARCERPHDDPPGSSKDATARVCSDDSIGPVVDTASTALLSLRVVYGDQRSELTHLNPDTTTVMQLRHALADAFDVPVDGQTRLIFRGKNLVAADPDTTLASLGLNAGFKGRLTLVGVPPSEVQQFHEEEDAIRRREAARSAAATVGQHRTGAGAGPRVVTAADAAAGQFLKLVPLDNVPPGAPSPSEALALLDKLRSDPGIVALMRKYKWTVGTLSEFAPSLQTGIVGVSSGCLLGYNKNRGEEISLRLRTDDFRGFRYYGVILKTLIHELTHMVHSDHDRHFWEFNSVLTKEYASLDWQKSTGRTVGGTAGAAMEWAAVDPAEMAAYAAAERAMAARASALPKLLSQTDGGVSTTTGGAAAVDVTTRADTTVPMDEDNVEDAVDMPGDTDTSQRTTPGNRATVDEAGTVERTGGQPTTTMGVHDLDTTPHSTKSVPSEGPTLQASSTAADSGVTPSNASVTLAARLTAYRDTLTHVQNTAEKDSVAVTLATSLLDLASACGGNVDQLSTSVRILHKLVANVHQHPSEAKYRTVKLSNPRIEAAIGRFPPAIVFLERVGFRREEQAQTLTYVRNDPGLLWLANDVLSSAHNALTPSE
eukprot:m.181536 g.181536  ORF g.181536 m.181536 type:complete len:625 (+) comp15299_c0_seq1:153-2027(+)